MLVRRHGGYSRSSKHRDIFCDISNGSDDLAAATDYIAKTRGVSSFLTYGISSGALRAALFASATPSVSRGSRWMPSSGPARAPDTGAAAQKLPEFMAKKRRPSTARSSASIFERDHPDCAEPRGRRLRRRHPRARRLDAQRHLHRHVFRLPVCDPEKITVPTVVLRGQFDGIASLDGPDRVLEAPAQPDKQFIMMSGISHASFQQKNYLMVYHMLHSFSRSRCPPTRSSGH